MTNGIRACLHTAQDYAYGAEGIWIDEQTWHEKAVYEPDTNAYSYNPYDRVSPAQVLDDARAMEQSCHALSETVRSFKFTMTRPEGASVAEAIAHGLALAREGIKTEGRLRSEDGFVRDITDIAEEFHTRWCDLEEAWQLVAEHDRRF